MSRFRKERSITALRRSIEKCLDEETNKGLFEAKWEIPKEIIEKKSYYQLQPVLEYFKNEKYTVEFLSDPEECKYVYFGWF